MEKYGYEFSDEELEEDFAQGMKDIKKAKKDGDKFKAENLTAKEKKSDDSSKHK